MKKLLLLSLPLMAIAGFNVWSEALAEPARIQRPGIVVPTVTATGSAASVDIPSGSAASVDIPSGSAPIPVAAVPKATRAASGGTGTPDDKGGIRGGGSDDRSARRGGNDHGGRDDG